MNTDLIIYYILTGLAALFTIMFHEIAHGFAAYALGDTTAKERGRLSLNPIKHIDWFGLLMLIVAGFGWAKPVPVDMRYFKNPRRDMALVALAGPLMNFLMALLSTIVIVFLSIFHAPEIIGDFFGTFLTINIGLGIFNLFPIPPLDGSKILGIILPEHIHMQILRYERFGMLILMVLLWTNVLNRPLGFLRDTVLGWCIQLYDVLYQLLGG